MIESCTDRVGDRVGFSGVLRRFLHSIHEQLLHVQVLEQFLGSTSDLLRGGKGRWLASGDSLRKEIVYKLNAQARICLLSNILTQTELSIEQPLALWFKTARK